MEFSSLTRDIAVGLVSSGLGAAFAYIPAAIKGWKADIEGETLSRRAAVEEAEKRAILEQKHNSLDTDFNAFAKVVRDRLRRLEDVFTMRTGELPRIDSTGENKRG